MSAALLALLTLLAIRRIGRGRARRKRRPFTRLVLAATLIALAFTVPHLMLLAALAGVRRADTAQVSGRRLARP